MTQSRLTLDVEDFMVCRHWISKSFCKLKIVTALYGLPTSRALHLRGPAKFTICVFRKVGYTDDAHLSAWERWLSLRVVCIRKMSMCLALILISHGSQPILNFFTEPVCPVVTSTSGMKLPKQDSPQEGTSVYLSHRHMIFFRSRKTECRSPA